MEKKIKLLKKFYLFFSIIISTFYFSRSSFPYNLKKSVYGFKTFSLLFHTSKKEVIINEKGKWWYVLCGGFHVGSYGYVCSENFFYEGSRGFNVLILGDNHIKVESFDTHKLEEESKRMEEFLKDLPDSCLCIMYIKDEGTLHLTSSLQSILKSFGSNIYLKDKYRWSYVFIFEKKKEEFKNILEMAAPDKLFLIKLKI